MNRLLGALCLPCASARGYLAWVNTVSKPTSAMYASLRLRAPRSGRQMARLRSPGARPWPRACSQEPPSSGPAGASGGLSPAPLRACSPPGHGMCQWRFFSSFYFVLGPTSRQKTGVVTFEQLGRTCGGGEHFLVCKQRTVTT